MAKQSKAERKLWAVVKLFYLLLVLVVLLSTATYTWFTLSRTPRVHDLSLYITSGEGMKLSVDEDVPWEEWSMYLDYSKYMYDNTVLKPVTWVNGEQRFYAADFGADGRIRGITYALNDTVNANGDNPDSYYVKFTFYAKTDNTVNVSLADANEQTGNFVVGMPEWDSEEIVHNNGGKGAQSAVRVGFMITKLDKDGNIVEAGEYDDPNPRFVIYEPNCDNHVDYTSDYVPTPGIDGGEQLVDGNDLIRQTTTAWLEAMPVQREVVVYSYGEFLDGTHLFKLDRDETAKIDLYIWLEGQDVDCTSAIGQAAKIIASIQFKTVTAGNSGMDEIE